MGIFRRLSADAKFLISKNLATHKSPTDETALNKDIFLFVGKAWFVGKHLFLVAFSFNTAAMNVPLLPSPPKVLVCVALIVTGFAAQISAQSSAYKNLVTAANSEIADTVAGINFFIYKVNPLAQHGDVAINLIQQGGAGNPHIYEISYTPDPGFVGVDTFALQYTYVNTWPYLVYQAFRVSVFPSKLTAKPDFAVTTVGTPVTIDVLDNDFGDSGPLTVSSVPLSNNGLASVNADNQVVFTPAPGFTGVAHVNYVVCDALNHCKTSFVNIGVNNNATPANDTLRVATAKNTILAIPLTYSGYEVFQAPANGIVALENGQIFRYTPNGNFTGVDQFILSNASFGATIFKTVRVEVLNTATQNTMAMDDYVYTPKGQPITFNVRDNDIGNLLVKSWVTPAGLPGTISNSNGAGTVTFTPNPNFTGVATFYYRIGNQFVPNLEMAAVHVTVGNMNPVFSSFEFTTPRQSPFVINYRIPFTNFEFDILDEPDNGTCTIYPGFSTQTINGQSVSGYNLLIYTPDNGFTGTDEFEINYCVTANGECKEVKVVMNVVDVFFSDPPYCVENCVWTGDINSDGIVNNKDLLPLGYFMGLDGLDRPNASLEWYGQHADNWDNPFAGNTIDVKHADTDGNGTITTDDTLALSLFYGQTDNLIPSAPPTSKNLPFFLNVLTPNPQVGDLVQVEVALGDASLPLTDLYGFTFDVSLSPNILDSALRMTYYDNSWLNLNAPSLWMEENPRQGRLETAFTRTNGVSAHGYGVIGQFEFIVIDIIIGGKPGESFQIQPSSFTITVDNPTLLSGDGNFISGSNFSVEIPIAKERSQNVSVSNDDFFVYPSPASDRLNFHLNGDDLMESLTIFDATAKAVYSSGDIQLERMELNVSNLPAGFYVASARTTSGIVVRKFQILR